MPYRLIATDLDRTLLNAAGEISPRSRQMISSLAKAGIVFLPITGRSFHVGAGLRDIKEIPYILCSNGARCFRNDTGETVFFQGLSREAALRVMELVRNLSCNRRVFMDGEIIGDLPGDTAGLENFFPYDARPAGANDLLSLLTPEHPLPEKLDINFPTTQARDEAWALCEAIPEVSLSAAWPFNLEINGPGGDKGSGMLRLASLLGISKEETMAFGDGWNDIALLKAAGRGVAMENAVPALKEIADDIAPLFSEDGEARYVEEQVLAFVGDSGAAEFPAIHTGTGGAK